MEKDYYAILGVAPTASQADIQRAYRAKSRELHPDVNPNTTDADMQALNEAYNVLRDAAKRAFYDQQRASQQQRSWSPPPSGQQRPYGNQRAESPNPTTSSAPLRPFQRDAYGNYIRPEPPPSRQAKPKTEISLFWRGLLPQREGWLSLWISLGVAGVVCIGLLFGISQLRISNTASSESQADSMVATDSEVSTPVAENSDTVLTSETPTEKPKEGIANLLLNPFVIIFILVLSYFARRSFFS